MFANKFWGRRTPFWLKIGHGSGLMQIFAYFYI
jgi:hypothetical protein